MEASPTVTVAGAPVALRKNALGAGGVTIITLGYVGLALSTYFVIPYALEANGPAVPLVFAVTVLALLPTGLSFAAMSRLRPSAGTAYTWMWEALHPLAGIWLGFIIVALYGFAVNAESLIGGEAFNSLLQFLGISSSFGSAILGGLLFSVVTAVLVFRDIRLSARSVLLFLGFEVGFVLLFMVYVVIKQGINGHLSAQPFLPSGITFGSTGFLAAIIFAFFSLAAVDAPATVAEEARAPRRIIPLVTIAVVVLSGVFYMFVSFALAVSEPATRFNTYLNSPVQAGAVYLVANDYIGWLKIFVVLTGISSILAFMVANMLMAARVTYALAREKLLPQWFAQVHPTHRTPRNAQLFFVVMVATIPLLISLWQGSSVVSGYAWYGGLFSGMVLFFYTVVNVVNIAFHARTNGVKFNWFMNGLVPVIGIAVSVYLLYDSFFKTYLALPFQTGTSVVLAWGLLVALSIVLTPLAWNARRRSLGAQATNLPVTADLDG